jgi:hypothetical protein
VWTDKGYKVPDIDKLLGEMKIKSRLMHKTYRKRPLTGWEHLFNRLISKLCRVVGEHLAV